MKPSTASWYCAKRAAIPRSAVVVPVSRKLDLIAPYWAEVSLRVAERVLHDYAGLGPPSWLDAEYFRKSVMGI